MRKPKFTRLDGTGAKYLNENCIECKVHKGVIPWTTILDTKTLVFCSGLCLYDYLTKRHEVRKVQG